MNNQSCGHVSLFIFFLRCYIRPCKPPEYCKKALDAVQFVILFRKCNEPVQSNASGTFQNLVSHTNL